MSILRLPNSCFSRYPERRCWLGAALAVLMLMGASPLRAAGLTEQQRLLATQLADNWQRSPELTSVQPTQRRNRQNQPTDSRSGHPLGRQILSVEKQENKHASDTRYARVYEYDYNTQRTHLLVIDLLTQRVDREQRINTVHLPLNQAEIDFASNVLADDVQLIAQLQAEQRKRGQSAFHRLSELDVKASIYEPMDASHRCAHERCALLSLFDQTRTVFATEPVVHMDTGTLNVLSTR